MFIIHSSTHINLNGEFMKDQQSCLVFVNDASKPDIDYNALVQSGCQVQTMASVTQTSSSSMTISLSDQSTGFFGYISSSIMLILLILLINMIVDYNMKYFSEWAIDKEKVKRHATWVKNKVVATSKWIISTTKKLIAKIKGA